MAGRKNIGHGQRDRFLDTEALAEEKKRGAAQRRVIHFLRWHWPDLFFRANACRRSEVDSSVDSSHMGGFRSRGQV